MNLSRRKLLAGLISMVAAPAIVKASNIMQIKVTDTFYDVIIDGIDEHGNKVSEVIKIMETLKGGLDMDYYKSACEIIKPKYKLVDSISWSTSMPLKRALEPNGWSHEEMVLLDAGGREFVKGINRSGCTALIDGPGSLGFGDTFAIEERMDDLSKVDWSGPALYMPKMNDL